MQLNMGKMRVGKPVSLCEETMPNYPGGQVNARGLTPLGMYLLTEMMRLGMLIDIDHMSQKAVAMSLSLAESMPGGYPLNSGHNGLREWVPVENRSEYSRTRQDIQRILQLGGMIGLGWGPEAVTFLHNLQRMLPLTGPNRIAFGTDVHGMAMTPHERMDTVAGKAIPASHVVYGPDFPKCTTGNRSWDYNTEGVAHYGLMPDYFKDVENLGGKKEIEALHNAAEGFAQMWERCELVAEKIRPEK
jgi:microsomal dipeptidase-like Zn-dependent dipeptidase